MPHTFKNIKIWEKAHSLVLNIYKITEIFPHHEKYGLTSQLRRAASSIPTNIVEGYKRRTKKDFAHFLNIAETSLEEVKYLLFLSLELGFLREPVFNKVTPLTDELGRMMFGFKKTLTA